MRTRESVRTPALRVPSGTSGPPLSPQHPEPKLAFGLDGIPMLSGELRPGRSTITMARVKAGSPHIWPDKSIYAMLMALPTPSAMIRCVRFATLRTSSPARSRFVIAFELG